MSTQSNTCRLCFEVCRAYKSLYSANGTGNELQEMIRKYFHPKIVDLDKAKMFTVICLECHQCIINFNTFEAKIIVRQLELLENPKDIDLKVEKNLCDLKSTIEKLSTKSTDQIVIQDCTKDVVENSGNYSNNHPHTKGNNATEPLDMAGPIKNSKNIIVEQKVKEIPSRNSTNVVINGSKDLNDDNQTSTKKESEDTQSASLIFPGNKQCNICNKTFIWGQSLNRHLRKHHATHDESLNECRARNVKDETIQWVKSQDEILIERIGIANYFENNTGVDGCGIAAEVANPFEDLRITINSAVAKDAEEHENTHLNNTFDRTNHNSKSKTDASNNAGRLMEEQNDQIEDGIIISQTTSAVTEDAETSSTTQQIKANEITKDLSEANLSLDYNRTEPKTVNIRANHPTVGHYKDTSTVEVASFFKHIDTQTHESIQTNVSIRPKDSCVIDLAQSREEELLALAVTGAKGNTPIERDLEKTQEVEFLQMSGNENIPTNIAPTVNGAEESTHCSGASKALHDTIEREISEIIVLEQSLEEEFLQISEDDNTPTNTAPTLIRTEDTTQSSGAPKSLNDSIKHEIIEIIDLDQSQEIVEISDEDTNLAPTGTGAEETTHSSGAPKALNDTIEHEINGIIVLDKSQEEVLVDISKDNNNPNKLAPTGIGAEESIHSSGASKALNDTIEREISVVIDLEQCQEEELVEISEDHNVPTTLAPRATGAEEITHESSAPMTLIDSIKRERIDIVNLEQSQEEELVEVCEDNNVASTLVPTGTEAEGNTCAGGAPKTFRGPINSKPNKGVVIRRNRKRCKFCRKQYFGPRDQYKHMKYFHRVVFNKKNIFPVTNIGKTVSKDANDSAISIVSLSCNTSKSRQPLCYVTSAMPSQREVYNKGICADEQASSTKLTGNTDRNSTRFNCRYCDRTYAWTKGLDRHMNQEHRDKSGYQRFMKSNLSYTAGPSVSSENKEKLAKSRTAVKCMLCPKTYANVGNLRRHMRRYHCADVEKNTNFTKTNVGERNCHSGKSNEAAETTSTSPKIQNSTSAGKIIQCKYCPKMYNQKSTAIQHMAIFHLSEYRKSCKFACNICEKAYQTEYRYNLHMETIHWDVLHQAKFIYNSEKKKYQCLLCDQSFQYAGHMSGHINQNHLNNPKANFKCHKCNRTFTTKTRLECHVNAGHLNTQNLAGAECETSVPEENHESALKCNNCKRVFKKPCYLDSHRKQSTICRPKEAVPESSTNTSSAKDVVGRATTSLEVEAPIGNAGCSSNLSNTYGKDCNSQNSRDQIACPLCDELFVSESLMHQHITGHF